MFQYCSYQGLLQSLLDRGCCGQGGTRLSGAWVAEGSWGAVDGPPSPHQAEWAGLTLPRRAASREEGFLESVQAVQSHRAARPSGWQSC